MKATPKTTAEFIVAVKTKYNLQSDYALAKKLGITPTSIYRFTGNKGSFSDATALHVAELLNLNSGYVLACIHAERAKAANEKSTWEKMARYLSTCAAAVLFFALVSSPIPSTDADPLHYAADNGSGSLYIMSNDDDQTTGLLAAAFLFLALFNLPGRRVTIPRHNKR